MSKTIRLDSRIAHKTMDKLLTITLAECGGNRRRAANMLGMSIRTLQRRIAARRKVNGGLRSSGK